MKETDTLPKAWQVHDSHEPFYSGGTAQVVLARDSSPSSSGAGAQTHTVKDVLACMYEENVKLMNWATGQHELTLLDEADENRERLAVFAMHPNGRELVAATVTGLLRHWSANHSDDTAPDAGVSAKAADKADKADKGDSKLQWRSVRGIKAHNMPILCLAYDPSGTLVASGSADRSVKVWDVERGYCTHNFKGHKDIVQLVKFHLSPAHFNFNGSSSAGAEGSPSMLRLYSTGHDCTVRVYDLESSSCVATHKNHLSTATAVDTAAASGEEHLLVSAGRDKVRPLFLFLSLFLFLFYATRCHLSPVTCHLSPRTTDSLLAEPAYNYGPRLHSWPLDSILVPHIRAEQSSLAVLRERLHAYPMCRSFQNLT